VLVTAVPVAKASYPTLHYRLVTTVYPVVLIAQVSIYAALVKVENPTEHDAHVVNEFL